MKTTRKVFTHDDYTVGWISALPVEMAAAKAMLDVVHPKLPQDPNDHNTYTLGSVCGHNVAIACLPSGVYGTTSAAIVATQMLFTFRALRFGLMVGVGGGVPSKEADIRLGDVVVSKPTDTSGGVVQYDYGKTVEEGYFQRTRTLNKPPQILLTAVSHLQAEKMMGISQMPTFLSRCVSKYSAMSQFKDNGRECDQLYEAEYDHVGPGNTCCDCDPNKLVVRPLRAARDPEIHYGLIASANQVMKHGVTRDRLARELHILCFEMEAAGLMDHFPCLVIRGICDYSDSHKNKQWQPYAAATAAAYTTELLSVISAHNVWRTVAVSDILSMALVGFTASITAFLDVSNRMLARLLEFHSPIKEAPEIFKHIRIQLPLIIDIMKQIEKDCGDSSVAPEARNSLLPVVNGSLQQITALDKLIQETLPTPTDSRLRRARKAVESTRKKKVMLAILKTLEGYKSTLTLYLEQKSGTATARLCKSEEMHAGKYHKTIVSSLANQQREMVAVQRQNMKIKCESWLKPSGASSVYKLNLPGTCEWIWTEPAFVEWSNPSPNSGRLLCVHGVHGCGKSVLATCIAKGLQVRKRLTLFFSFSGSDGNRRTLDSLARALLWQLLDGTSDQKAYEIMDDLMHRGPITTPELFEALINTAKLETGLVYCIIDGVDECIDECNDPARGLLKHVLDLIDYTNLHIALLGRPYALQAAISATTLKIKMNSDLTKTDIEEFIRAEIEDSRILKTQELRDVVFEELREKSGGMFLWVKLMIDDLRKSATKHEIMDRLRSTPRGLKELYRILFSRLAEKLDDLELILARKALAFTIISCRALTVDELRYSYALDIGSASTLEDHLLLQPERRIMDVCGGLINFSRGHAQLIHISVKEFLTRPEEQWSSNEDHKIKCFRVDLEATHRSLGSICVDYLGMSEYDFSLLGTDAFSELGIQYPFLEYASRHVISHLIQSGPPCAVILGKINDFLESQKSATWMEYLAMLLVDDMSNVPFGCEIETFASWLYEEDHAWKLFESKLRMIWDRELTGRIRRFGEDDQRTERWREFLDIVGPEPGGDSRVPNAVFHESPRGSADVVSQILNLINSHATLPLPRQFDMILKLGSHLSRVKILSDPLRLLFEVILKMADKIPISVLLIIGDFYDRLDKLEDAVNVYYAALAKTESQEAPIKFTTLQLIGNILSQQKKHAEAEAMYRRAIEGREIVLGKEHPDTLDSIGYLGYTLYNQGKYVEAGEMYRRATEGRQRVLGKEDPVTLTTINNFGHALFCQGKYTEAEEMYRRAVEGRQRVLGKEDPDTFTSIDNLSSALYRQGKYTEAEEIYRRQIEGRQRVLGKEDPGTFTLINNLGGALYGQGKYTEAEEMYRRAIEGRQRVLGKEYPGTLTFIKNLGGALYGQGKYTEAEEMYRRAIEERQRVLGKEDPGTLTLFNNLGYALRRQGKYTEAEEMCWKSGYINLWPPT